MIKENNNNDKVLLIICPYAGGSGYGMRKYFFALEDIVDVCCIDYSGHGLRYRSKLNNTFMEMIMDVKQMILKYSDRKIILMGHSMGGIIIAYVSQMIKMNMKENFIGMIISSCLPPDLFELRHQNNNMDKEDLCEYLHSERGVDREIIESEEFEHCILPIVISDFEVLNDFKNYNKKNKLEIPDCKKILICGKHDYGIEVDAMEGWKKYFGKDTPIYSVEGGHFYFEEDTETSIAVFKDIINKIIEEEDKDDIN